MANQLLLCTTLISSIIIGSSSASSVEFGTSDEAKTMIARAVQEVRADKSRAVKMFNHNEGAFRDRDLFVFCFNGSDGRFTAHEAMIGSDVRALRDRRGNDYGAAMFQKAAEDRITEVGYMSPVPGSTAQNPKRAYVIRVGDQVCGVSAYLAPDEPLPPR